MLESVAHPSRLQLIYEILPVAFLIEKAGGSTSDGSKSLLDSIVTGYKQKSSFVAGSKNDVAKIITRIKDEEEMEHKKMSEIASIQSTIKAWTFEDEAVYHMASFWGHWTYNIGDEHTYILSIKQKEVKLRA